MHVVQTVANSKNHRTSKSPKTLQKMLREHLQSTGVLAACLMAGQIAFAQTGPAGGRGTAQRASAPARASGPTNPAQQIQFQQQQPASAAPAVGAPAGTLQPMALPPANNPQARPAMAPAAPQGTGFTPAAGLSDARLQVYDIPTESVGSAALLLQSQFGSDRRVRITVASSPTRSNRANTNCKRSPGVNSRMESAASLVPNSRSPPRTMANSHSSISSPSRDRARS